MSLTTLVEEPEVRERLSWCIPDPQERKLIAEPLVPRARVTSPKREAMLGTAIDYALRFEIERNNRHASKRDRWVADRAARLGPQYGAALREAREHVQAHVRSGAPWRGLTVARCALMLAQLDPYTRSGGMYVPQPPRAEPSDVVEVFRMVQAAPIAELSHSTCVYLNPVFGRYSGLVGGGDADLIIGSRLIDVKLALPDSGVIEPEWIRQLVGYAMLSAWQRADLPRAPEVRAVAIYFAREGVFWSLAPGLLRRSAFSATARWLRERVEARVRSRNAQQWALFEEQRTLLRQQKFGVMQDR